MEKIKANDGNISELIKTIGGRPRSGKLAAKGCYDLNSTVRDILQEEEDKKTEHDKAMKVRK